MPRVQYRLVNVFAETPFGGNPLAVIEDGRGLSTEEMQAIARQFNLSETTFLLPSDRAAARVRIFATSYEMDFAGHPTLGSAAVVRERFAAGDRFDLEMNVGLVPVSAAGDRWSMSPPPPIHQPLTATASDLAAMLSLPEEAISGPRLWMDCGVQQAFVPLARVEQLRAIRPVPDLLWRHARNAQGQSKTFAFVRTESGFEARYFSMAEGAGLREDPATGSACVNLGGWWMATEGGSPLDAAVVQGLAIQRPSRMDLKVKDGRIEVGGRVLELGRGELSW